MYLLACTIISSLLAAFSRCIFLYGAVTYYNFAFVCLFIFFSFLFCFSCHLRLYKAHLLKLSFSLLFAGIFNHAVPSASSPHQFGASFSSSAVSSSTVLSLNPLQAVASTSSSSFPPSSSNLVTSSETRPAQHLNRAPVQSVFHPPPPPPNVSLPPPPPLLASNSEPALLQNLPSIPPGETFLPSSSSAPVQSNSSLSLKLASLQHKPSRPSFTVHHPPLPRVLPQPNAAGTAAMWVTLGMQPPYASHLSGVKPR